MVTIEKIDNNSVVIDGKSIVKVKITGNIIEVKFINRPIVQTIQKIDSQSYINLSTGELKKFKQNETRIDNLKSLKTSMRNLRDIINTNCVDLKKCKFLTLTYRENMKDCKKLYADVKKFHMRFRYYLKDIPFNYISVIEPQGRGAYHIHEILIFEHKAPYIDNQKVAEIWKHGFTKTENIKNGVDNIGMYLSSYFCDVVNEDATVSDTEAAKYSKFVTNESGKKVSKRVLKGARLKYYPQGFRLYRCSRGIKRPAVFECSNEYAMKLVENANLFYEQTIKITDNDYVNIINYRQYSCKIQ